MKTPRVTEVQNRRLRPLLDEIAADENRRISAQMFRDVRGHDPLLDVTFDVGAVVTAHHDYPSADLWDALDARSMA